MLTIFLPVLKSFKIKPAFSLIRTDVVWSKYIHIHVLIMFTKRYFTVKHLIPVKHSISLLTYSFVIFFTFRCSSYLGQMSFHPQHVLLKTSCLIMVWSVTIEITSNFNHYRYEKLIISISELWLITPLFIIFTFLLYNYNKIIL